MSAGSPGSTGYGPLPPAAPLPPGMFSGANWGVVAGGAMGIIQGWMASEQASKQNVALINAQTVAYRQMAEYTKSTMGRYGVFREFNDFERDNIGLQAISARRSVAADSNKTEGMFRARQADSGVAMSGSKQRLAENIARLNRDNERNLESNIANSYMQSAMQYREQIFANDQNNKQIVQQYQNQINSYNNNMVDATIAGISGSIGGIGTGINIATGIRGLQDPVGRSAYFGGNPS